MIGIAAFGLTDTGMVTGDMTLTATAVSDGTSIDTTGWSLTELGRGMYAVSIPLASVSCVYYIYKTSTPTIFFDGSIDASPAGSGATVQQMIDGGIAIVGSPMTLASSSISSATFAPGAITAAAIASNAIGALELASDAITKIATGVWDAILADRQVAGSAAMLLARTTDVTALNNLSEVQAQAAVAAALAAYNAVTTSDLSDIPGSVVDEVLTGGAHEVPGSLSVLIRAAASAGDPWVSDLSTPFTENQAGHIMKDVDANLQQFILLLSSMISQVYQAGTVSNPHATTKHSDLELFADSDYDGIVFTLDPVWTSYLQEADAEVWFTILKDPRTRTVLLDAQGVITNAVTRTVTVPLTASQLDIVEGMYFWQVMVRRPITTGVPPVTTIKRRLAMEGKVQIKPSFKVEEVAP